MKKSPPAKNWHVNKGRVRRIPAGHPSPCAVPTGWPSQIGKKRRKPTIKSARSEIIPPIPTGRGRIGTSCLRASLTKTCEIPEVWKIAKNRTESQQGGRAAGSMLVGTLETSGLQCPERIVTLSTLCEKPDEAFFGLKRTLARGPVPACGDASGRSVC